MAKPKKAKEPVSTPEAAYSVSVSVGGSTYQGAGATILEALQKAGRPSKIMGKGKLIISNGAKTVEKTLWPVPLKRLFYPAFQHIHAKSLTQLFR